MDAEFIDRCAAVLKVCNEAREALDKARRDLYLLREKCVHESVEFTPNARQIKLGLFPRTNCRFCCADLGWWCPDSSRHFCEYSESDDWCDHCGDPEERK